MAINGGYANEPKWDRFQALVGFDGQQVQIAGRSGKDLTRYFPELVPALMEQLPDRCVLDGELVVLARSAFWYR